MTKEKAWVGVVSAAHVAHGVAGGFAQVCHGKQAPLARMAPGDWFIYYSPSTERHGGAPLRAFTAIGRVRDERMYSVEMAPGFVPHRRDIVYLPTTRTAPVAVLSHALHFVRQHPSWGMLARRGHFPIDLHDVRVIGEALGAPNGSLPR